MFSRSKTTRVIHAERESAALTVLLMLAYATGCQQSNVSLESGDAYASHWSADSPKPNRRDIVFVIDASGSMMEALPLIEREMKQVVNDLVPYIHVTVICFSGRGVYEVDSVVGWSGPRACTPGFKQELREWLSLTNHHFKRGGAGSRYAEHAIVRALRYQPELIFILSDDLTGAGGLPGNHEIDQNSLLAMIHAQNDVQKPARINTIQWLYGDPLARQGMRGTLERIADETGGSYKFISHRDLDLN